MAQQPAHRHLALARGRELGPVLGHRGVDVELAPLGQQVGAQGGGALGRAEHQLERVVGVGRHGRGVGDAAPQVDDLAPVDVDGADRRPRRRAGRSSPRTRRARPRSPGPPSPRSRPGRRPAGRCSFVVSPSQRPAGRCRRRAAPGCPACTPAATSCVAPAGGPHRLVSPAARAVPCARSSAWARGRAGTRQQETHATYPHPRCDRRRPALPRGRVWRRRRRFRSPRPVRSTSAPSRRPRRRRRPTPPRPRSRAARPTPPAAATRPPTTRRHQRHHHGRLGLTPDTMTAGRPEPDPEAATTGPTRSAGHHRRGRAAARVAGAGAPGPGRGRRRVRVGRGGAVVRRGAGPARAAGRPRSCGTPPGCGTSSACPPGSSCSSAPPAGSRPSPWSPAGSPPAPRPSGRPRSPASARSPWRRALAGPRLPAVAVLAGGLLSLLVCNRIKGLVERPRPVNVRLREAQDGFGYPSSHTATAFGAAVVLTFLVPRRWRWAPLTVAAIVGLTRMHVGVHYPLDMRGRRPHRPGGGPGGRRGARPQPPLTGLRRAGVGGAGRP